MWMDVMIKHVLYTLVGRDSSVGIVTRYELDGPGIELPWAARFSSPYLAGPGTHPASYTIVTGFFPRGKAART
jgi:hypothetical protein